MRYLRQRELVLSEDRQVPPNWPLCVDDDDKPIAFCVLLDGPPG
jgi:hypothetical protein